MFEFAKQPVKLVKVSTPMENHGQELKLGVVLTIVGVFPNTILKAFGAGLLESLFRKPTEEERADLATDPDTLCMLRHPRMSPFSWDYETDGNQVTIDHGLGGDSDIKLVDVKVKSVEITPLEGAMCSIQWNINCHPDQKDVGALAAKQKQDIAMELNGPAPQSAEDLFNKAA
ncbi:hypothetical protein [Herbaspirillum seropedicae]|uniref:hypothetical protein n=1 Tax=Herbaspirillum seropedicae TaxID=964 RepID=UPI003FCD6B73